MMGRDPSLLRLPLVFHLFFASCIFGQYDPYHQCNPCRSDNTFTTHQGAGQILQNLKTNTSFPSYATASNHSLFLYALLQCERDLPTADCDRCSTVAANRLAQNCSQQVLDPDSGSAGGYMCSMLPAVDAMVWYDDCFLRYDNQSFYSRLDTYFYHLDIWNPNSYGDTISEKKKNDLMRALACEAGSSTGRGFAKGSSPSKDIFGLVQCNQDITMDDCSKCLQIAVNRSIGPCKDNTGSDCQSKVGRKILMKNCYARYEQNMFYNDNSEGLVKAPSSKCNFTGIQGNSTGIQGNGTDVQVKGRSNKILYYVLGGAGGGVALLFVGLVFFFISNNWRKTSALLLPSALDPIQEKEMQVFSWDDIVAATNNFSIENKLGEGGFGIVYWGKLANGREVAVKKLLFRPDQGRKEFLNEVGLVSKLQHRNLVSLVGCCVEDQERLLVFDYMPNGSLDTLLFDPIKKSRLNWETRLELIMGIARGLRYLHEESAFQVIHRDIKAANVLLDDQLRPKISDFGMARLSSVDQSVVATRIAGTYGYMDPEYVLHGILSTKVDIYSFGVVILEIISGRRNNDRTLPMVGDGFGLVGWVNTLQKEGKYLEFVDQDLGENWPEQFVLRCIHVALLCTKSMSSQRPSISVVIMMLSSNLDTLPDISSHNSDYSISTNQTTPLMMSSNDLTITELSGR